MSGEEQSGSRFAVLLRRIHLGDLIPAVRRLGPPAWADPQACETLRNLRNLMTRVGGITTLPDYVEASAALHYMYTFQYQDGMEFMPSAAVLRGVPQRRSAQQVAAEDRATNPDPVDPMPSEVRYLSTDLPWFPGGPPTGHSPLRP